MSGNHFRFDRPVRYVTRVFIHCSASSNKSLRGYGLVEEITRWHLARGFSTIGYHYVIDKEGRILEGRSLERMPAAQKGHNRGTIAICVHGGGGRPPRNDFTAKQDVALAKLCRAIWLAYHTRVTFHGHREVANKACPVFDYREVLRLDDKGRMRPNKEPAPLPSPNRRMQREPVGAPALAWHERLCEWIERSK